MTDQMRKAFEHRWSMGASDIDAGAMQRGMISKSAAWQYWQSACAWNARAAAAVQDLDDSVPPGYLDWLKQVYPQSGMAGNVIWNAATKAALAASPSTQEPVAYLDLGVGGYIDVGSDLSDEELAALPKGRHMLGIIGTYGVDGYVPASPQAQEARDPSEEAEHFIESLIDSAPEPFRRLGEYLATNLDEDQFKHAESLLLGGLKAVQDGRDLQGDIDHYNRNMG